MYASQRTLRLADGPDEVHWFVVGRAELARWSEVAKDYSPKAAYLERRQSGRAFDGP
jgi:acyl-CoA dehydrogenase